MLRQYFMALRTVGQWKHLSDHWVNVVENCETPISPIREGAYGFPSMDNLAAYLPVPDRAKVTEDSADPWSKFLKRRFMVNAKPVHENVDSEVDEDDDSDEDARDGGDQLDFEILLMRKFWTRWALKTGVKSSICDPLKEGAFSVDWTRCIAPVVDGRIKMVES